MNSETNANSIYKSKNIIGKTYRGFFILLHIVHNLDFGFVERRTPRSKLFIRIITLTKCAFGATIYVFLLNIEIPDKYIIAQNIYSASSYVYLVFILSFSNNASFYRLQSDLFSIDSMIKNTCSYNIEVTVILAVIVSDLYVYGISLLHCSLFPNECHGSFLLKFWAVSLLNSLNTVFIMCFFIFYSVYCRLQLFVKNMNNGSPMQESLNIYTAVMDSLDRVKMSFDFLYIATLALELPVLVTAVYYYLIKVSFAGTVYNDAFRILHFIQVATLMCAPAISAGLVTSKAEELKLILQNRLLTERNEPHSGAIELFMDYVHARPMEFTLFKVFPLDWSLPVYTLNLCITYQIAIVQLTHLF